MIFTELTEAAAVWTDWQQKSVSHELPSVAPETSAFAIQIHQKIQADLEVPLKVSANQIGRGSRFPMSPKRVLSLASESATPYRIRRLYEKERELYLECPALFVPVDVRETGMRGALNGTRKEAYAGADCEPASAG